MVIKLWKCLVISSLLLIILALAWGCGNNYGDNPAQFVFLYFSDTQADPDTEDYTKLGELMTGSVTQEQIPSLVIFGGDTVNDGGYPDEWHDFWQVASRLDDLTTAAVAGNHDNHPLLTEQFDYPAKAPSAPGDGFFYSLNMEGVYFLMLDSNVMGAGRREDVQWLRSELESDKARQATWRIVVMHHPMWPIVDNQKDIDRAETMREHFLPVMEEYGVDLILCGHQHLYARSVPMKGKTSAGEDGGIVQIMAASGDKQSYVTGENTDFIAVDAQSPNYLLISADNVAFKVTAYGEDQQPFDSFILTTQKELHEALKETSSPLPDITEPFTHIYSTVNNWPAWSGQAALHLGRERANSPVKNV